jgi:hypothetical protein
VKRTLLVAILVLLGVASVAQEASLSSYARPRRMLYFFETEPDELAAFDSFLLYNGILATVGTANPSVVLVESPELLVPQEQTGKEEMARRPEVSADAWLSIYVGGDLEFLTIRYEIYDMLLREVVGAGTINPGFPVSYRILARGFWDEIADIIGAGFEPVIDATPVTFSAVAGTTLADLPGGPYTIPESGTLTVALPNPATYVTRAELSGYVPASRDFYLGFQPLDVEIVQLATPKLAVDAWISGFQFPGARFWYYITPAQWFARAAVTTQLIGINLVPNRPLFSSAPLSSIAVDGGIMFLDEASRTRLYAAGGFFLRITHAPNILGLDHDGAYGGIHLSLGAEISPWRGVRFLQQFTVIADYQPAFYFAPSPEDFVAVSFSWNAFPDGQVPGFVMFDWGLMDLRNLFLGIKFSW